jgi:anion-transporting  ArsA/GET3 family ATPase
VNGERFCRGFLERIDFSAASQYIFVGGKGGVGKTSISSALSICLSKGNTHNHDNDYIMLVNLTAKGLRVLVVSTDPAHSLGDALEAKLSGSPTFIQGKLLLTSCAFIDNGKGKR